MRARGDFGDDTAMRGMDFHLRGDFRGQHAAVAPHHGRRRFIAAAFDAENKNGIVHGRIIRQGVVWRRA